MPSLSSRLPSMDGLSHLEFNARGRDPDSLLGSTHSTHDGDSPVAMVLSTKFYSFGETQTTQDSQATSWICSLWLSPVLPSTLQAIGIFHSLLLSTKSLPSHLATFLEVLETWVDISSTQTILWNVDNNANTCRNEVQDKTNVGRSHYTYQTLSGRLLQAL